MIEIWYYLQFIQRLEHRYQLNAKNTCLYRFNVWYLWPIKIMDATKTIRKLRKTYHLLNCIHILIPLNVYMLWEY